MSVYLARSAVSPTISGRFARRAPPAPGRTALRRALPSAGLLCLAHRERYAGAAVQTSPRLQLVRRTRPIRAARRGRNAPSRAARASACRGPAEVRSTIAFGLPSRLRAPMQRRDDRRPCRCRRSRLVSQPKARHLSATGSMSMTIFAVGLDAVAVDQRDEVVEAETAARHHGFPGRALLQLAVGEFAEDARVATCPAAARAPCRPPGRAHARASRRSSRRPASCRASTCRAGSGRRRRYRARRRGMMPASASAAHSAIE